MARSVAKLKMGFYPLPVSEGANLRQLLSFTGPASVVDPCVGQGVALNLITHGADVRRYGVELDAERALAASAKGIETIQGNTFDAVAKPESFSLLYLNPPYDSEIGSVGNSRMERLFLEHTFRWLVMEGVLVLVIPFERLHECAGVLSSHFARLNIFRMTDEESVRFRQITVLGVRRNVRGVAVEEARRQLQRIGPYGSFQALPELVPGACEPYPVPSTGEAALSYRGLPYDLLEDLLPLSGAWKQTLPFSDAARGRGHRAADHAAARRPCGAALHGGPSEWSLRPGRRPAHRAMEIGQACDHLRRRGRRRADHPSPGTVGERVAIGLCRWQNPEADRDAGKAGRRRRCRMRT